jgi:hypothetical protein
LVAREGRKKVNDGAGRVKVTCLDRFGQCKKFETNSSCFEEVRIVRPYVDVDVDENVQVTLTFLQKWAVSGHYCMQQKHQDSDDLPE